MLFQVTNIHINIAYEYLAIFILFKTLFFIPLRRFFFISVLLFFIHVLNFFVDYKNYKYIKVQMEEKKEDLLFKRFNDK